MPEGVWSDFSLLADTQAQRFTQRVQSAMLDFTKRASFDGALGSSHALARSIDIVADYVGKLVRSAFHDLIRALNAHGVAITNDNKSEIVARLNDWIECRVAEMEEIARSSPPFKAVVNPAGEFLKPIRAAAKLEFEGIRGEINLVAANNSRQQNTSDAVSVVFNAPVGQAIVGTGSMGVYVGDLDAKTRQQLLSVLREIENNIGATDVKIDAPEDEVRELIRGAEDELNKERPNVTKLKSTLAGIGAVIMYAPKLKDAYDTLKWAAGLIGLQLPLSSLPSPPQKKSSPISCTPL